MVLGDFKFLGVPCHSIELDDLKVFMGKHPTPILAVWTISATFAPC